MEPNKKTTRNKTIAIDVREGAHYLERCISVTRPVKLEEVLNQTILGDTFDVLKNLPAESVDLLIADPPYNLNKNYHGRSFHQMDAEAYRTFTDAWLQAVIPLLKKDASVYVCCDWRTGMILGPMLEEFLHVRNRITWQREKGRSANANWKNAMEDIWFATKSDTYVFHGEAVKQRRRVIAPYRENGLPKDWEETKDGKFRNTGASNFWDDISIPYWSMKENTAHPTQKPEKLLAKLILASSDPGDVVLDPFLGSGSSSVTAKKLGRHYIGIEQNEQYCIWAEKRLEMAEHDSSIQGYADGVFWERNTASLQKEPCQRKSKQKNLK